MKNEIRIPEHWTSRDVNKSAKGNPQHWQCKNIEEMKKKRRLDWIPDPSFDLNGDGTISFREYAIAKMFDFDLDKKLNEAEKAECMKRINEGFERTILFEEDIGTYEE